MPRPWRVRAEVFGAPARIRELGKISRDRDTFTSEGIGAVTGIGEVPF
jgi:hypothetical protein